MKTISTIVLAACLAATGHANTHPDRLVRAQDDTGSIATAYPCSMEESQGNMVGCFDLDDKKKSDYNILRGMIGPSSY